MLLKIQKWGNSLALRIPKAYASDIRLGDGSSVELLKSEDSLIIKPKKSPKKLSALLAKITEGNIHQEVPSSRQVGKEVW